MHKDEISFEKLLSDAPAATDADSLTVVGVLARTADPARFSLTLPNGQAQILNVNAVKSSRKLAGAVGQFIVELVLDAEQVPENLRASLNSWGSYPAESPENGTGTHTHKDTIGGGIAPFVAAAPHHVQHELFLGPNTFNIANRTYFTPNSWGTDVTHITKAYADPGTQVP